MNKVFELEFKKQDIQNQNKLIMLKYQHRQKHINNFNNSNYENRLISKMVKNDDLINYYQVEQNKIFSRDRKSWIIKNGLMQQKFNKIINKQ